jgi:hypothetical protein
MKKEILFILFLIGLISSLGVYAWPNMYPSQLINTQGYYQTNESNTTWQPVTISPMYYWQPVYRNWIGEYRVSYSLPTNAAVFAAYGCCNLNNNSGWSINYSCNFTETRYRVQINNDWKCGWNIARNETSLIDNTNRYSCTDSDGGINYNVQGYSVSDYNGTKNDTCSSRYVIKEAYCSGYSSSYSIYNCQHIGSDYECSNGRCMIGGSNQTNDTCFDTDGGLNYNVWGQTITNLGNNPDYCMSAQYLEEAYCVVNLTSNTSDYMRHNCYNRTNMTNNSMCYNGICVPTSCFDSDGGQNLMQYGYITVNAPSGPYTYYDSCMGSIAVMERYCYYGQGGSAGLNCPQNTHCTDGRCINNAG